MVGGFRVIPEGLAGLSAGGLPRCGACKCDVAKPVPPRIDQSDLHAPDVIVEKLDVQNMKSCAGSEGI